MSKRSLTDEQVHEICQLLMNGASSNYIAERYNISGVKVAQIKYKKIYREITGLYNLEETWVNRHSHKSKYSEKFINFIFKCIKNDIPVDEILLDERCEISNKDKLSKYISNIRTGRIYRNRLIENKMYNDDTNNPINNTVVCDDIIISIANDIKSNPLITNKELSEKYNLSRKVISNIRNGKTGNIITNIHDNNYKLITNISDDIIISIANDIKSNPLITNKELSEKYNLSNSSIHNIRNGKSYSDITGFTDNKYTLYIAKCKIAASIANDIKSNPKITNKELSEKYNLPIYIISNIRNGRLYHKITGIKKGQYNLYKNKEK